MYITNVVTCLASFNNRNGTFPLTLMKHLIVQGIIITLEVINVTSNS